MSADLTEPGVDHEPTGVSRGTPAGTTALFLLLITAVLATSSIVFYSLNLAMTSGHADEGRWMLTGMGVLTGLACVVYGFAPWWIERRRGLVDLTETNAPDLLPELRDLCGLAKVGPPRFLLAPYAVKTAGGLAFGHAWDRCVMLDAGLVSLATTDRATFRAVVLHELAHLRNRDVDITYSTVAIWRAFVVVAIPPMLVLAFWPTVFHTASSPSPNWWSVARVSFSLISLTLVVFLTRNALLRTRELHADARVATWDADSAGSELRDLFATADSAAGRQAFLRRVWDDHPHPGQRVEAIDHPERLSRPSAWEFFAVGMVTAVFLEHGFLVGGSLFPNQVNLATYGMLVMAVAAVAAVLVLGVVRAEPGRRVLLFPVVLVAGFLAGEATSLINLAGGRWVMFGRYGEDVSWRPAYLLATAAPLLVGAVLLTAWAASAVAGAREVPGPVGRGALVGLTAALAVATAPWLELWWTMRGDVGQSVASALGEQDSAAPVPDGLPEGYAVVIDWLERLTLWPDQHLLFVGSAFVPWVLVGVILLWWTPLAVIALRRRRAGWRGANDIGRALLVAAACVVVLVAFTVVHLLVVKGAYDRELHSPELWAKSNVRVFGAVAIAVEALGAGVVMVVTRGPRPALALLSIFTTGTAATLLAWRGTMPGNCFALIGTMVEDLCLAPLDGDKMLAQWHYLIVFGVIAAVPVVIATGLRRKPPVETHYRPDVAGQRVRPRSVVASVATVAVLVVALVANNDKWITFSHNETGETCLPGDWTETSYRRNWDVPDIGVIVLSRTGVVHRFSSDGSVRVDFGTSTVEEGTHDGRKIAYRYSGSLRLDYDVGASEIEYRNPVSDGTKTLTVDDRAGTRQPLVVGDKAERFSCDGDRLTLETDSYRIELTRD